MNPNITPIGVTHFQNNKQVFGIKSNDRVGHIYCIGKTGVGKSTLLLNMALSDIHNNHTVAIIDPHGDLAESLLTYIPTHRINDVIYLDTSLPHHSIAYNPIYNIKEDEKHLVAQHIVSVFKKLWSESWGPRLEHILRNAIHSLTYFEGATLLDIQPLLTDYYFRQTVKASITHPALLSFWNKEYEPLTPQAKTEHTASIVNKIGLLSTHPILSNIFGQRVSSFSIDEVVNQNKIFIANLSKGNLGETGTELLGSLFITQFHTLALRRNKLPIQQRTPIYLYIDEVHSFMTDSFIDILSESRKYGLSLFLTHQYTEQLKPDILKGILGNVGTLICFRLGSVDANVLEEEFYPILSKVDLINLPQYAIYLKLLIDGTTSTPFSANTLPLAHKVYKHQELIKNENREKYGTLIKPIQPNISNTYKKNDDEVKQQHLDFD